MAPIADASNDLHTARPMRGTRVVSIVRIIVSVFRAVETLLELAADLLPMLAVRMAHNRLVWSNGDIVGKSEPLVMTLKNSGDQQ